MSRPVCLDLFCGAGGASMGLYRAGFDVVGVDIKPQPHYPSFHDAEYAKHFRFIQADAMTFPLEGYDCYWASPPCQGYTTLRAMWNAKEHPKLIGDVRARFKATGLPYIIENVAGAADNMQDYVTLCGSSFGLGCRDAELRRHRLFEVNPPLLLVPPCSHNWQPHTVSVLSKCGGGLSHARAAKAAVIGVYGGHGRDRRRRINTQGYPTEARREAMGIEWMNGDELSQAIPPAFSEYLGKYMLSAVISGGHRRADSGRGHKYDTCASLDPDIQTQRKNALAGNESSEHLCQLASGANDESSLLLGQHQGVQDSHIEDSNKDGR